MSFLRSLGGSSSNRRGWLIRESTHRSVPGTSGVPNEDKTCFRVIYAYVNPRIRTGRGEASARRGRAASSGRVVAYHGPEVTPLRRLAAVGTSHRLNLDGHF